MTDAIIKALTKGNKNSENASSFYAESSFRTDLINVNVPSIGALEFPLSMHAVESLLSMATQAQFGFKEQTLTDTSVRDCYELSSDKLSVTFDSRAINQMIDEMKIKLGLPKQSNLSPYFHNLLIYGPGQFFKTHQDSEKIPGMVATLILVLPSPHIGGDLVISHNDENHLFKSQNLDEKNIKCVAFYADCDHEVKPVSQGYRVALTYNLVFESAQINLNDYANEQLTKAVDDYFKCDVTPQEEPTRFVYFLDHSYSEHSLKWDLLKGADRTNALAFRYAARELGLVSYLALVEHHETWGTDEPYDYRSRYSYDDDEDDEVIPELTELLDHSTTLNFWVDEQNLEVDFGNISINERDYCHTRAMSEFSPFNSEHEGWMGNYGNTMDYWYRRAAVVLWKQSDQTCMDFKLRYEYAFNELEKLTHEPGHEHEIIQIIEKVGQYVFPKFNRSNLISESKSDFFNLFSKIAVYIKNPSLAATLLKDTFDLTIINQETTQTLVDLEREYGLDWCVDLIKLWHDQSKRNLSALQNIQKSIHSLFITLRQSGVSMQLIKTIFAEHVYYYEEKNKEESGYPLKDLNKSASIRQEIAQSILLACDFVGDVELIDRVITQLTTQNTLYSTLMLAEAVLFLKKSISNDHLVLYAKLQLNVVQRLKNESEKGLKSEDDWSIESILKCKCDYCRIANTFIVAPNEHKKVWPIAQNHRYHIKEGIANAALPIECREENTGRPYKLILTKDKNMYANRKKRFELVHEMLKQLT